MPNYLFVDRPDDISQTIGEHARVGVDTEFMREKTYFAQLCLVQVSTPDAIYCVDPLTDTGKDAFWSGLLANDWIVHSARQDIEVIFQATGAMPRQIFDTQVAAGLLGMPAQLGYAGLVKTLFDVDMAKSHTRADWTRRPLPAAFLEYAAEDVEYLIPAAERLAEKLQAKGRLDWAIEDSALLLDPTLYELEGSQAIDRIKGARNFRGRRRAAAVRLANWREAEAIRRDRPRQWIMRDNVLLDIAARLPADLRTLGSIAKLSPKIVARAGKEILATVTASGDDDDRYEPPRPPGEAQKALLKELQALVASRAADLDIAAETLAPKRELSSIIISGSRQSRVLTGWREEVVGTELRAML